jgi:hypothetical protein
MNKNTTILPEKIFFTKFRINLYSGMSKRPMDEKFPCSVFTGICILIFKRDKKNVPLRMDMVMNMNKCPTSLMRL